MSRLRPTSGCRPSRSAISARNWAIVQLRRAGLDAGLQRPRTVAQEVAAPQADRIFTHPECLGDARARPAGQRQQHGTRAVRLAAIT
jgi:hypothetical protein